MIKRLLLFWMICLIIGISIGALTGCDEIKKFVGTQVDEMTPEKALKIAEQGEVFYSKAKSGITDYIQKNPNALTEEQKTKLTAGSAAFELVYTNTKVAIIKVYAAKNGGKVTISDIKDDLIILAGEYVKFKKLIQPLLGDTIAYPDEVKTNTISTETNIKIEEVIPVAPTNATPEPTSTAEPTSSSPATTPATPPAGAPTT